MKRRQQAIKRTKGILAGVILLGLCLVLASSAKAAETKKQVKVTSVSFTNGKTLGTLYVGKSYQLKTQVLPTKATKKKLKWTTSNKGIAQVSGGKITPKKPGKVRITATATDGSKKKASYQFQVKQRVTQVSYTNIIGHEILYVGKSFNLKTKILPSNASSKKLIWTSSNGKKASVSSKGTVKALAPGKVKITATATDGSKKKTSYTFTVKQRVTQVSVAKPTEKLYVGKAIFLTATLLPSNASDRTLIWSTSDPAVATVSPNGTVIGVGNGTVTITAKAADGSNKKGSRTMTVTTLATGVAIASNTDSKYLKKGETLMLQAVISPETVSNQSTSWSSSDTSILTVDSQGLVTARENGFADVTVKTQDGTDQRASLRIYVISINKINNRTYAHRGYSAVAPDNSLTSITLAIGEGFTGVEVDLRKTADGVYVLSHDDSLLENFGVDRYISSSTYGEIKDLVMTAGNNVGTYSQEKLVTLDQLMSLVAGSEIKLYLELKENFSKDDMKEIFGLVNSYHINNRICFTSFKITALQRIKTQAQTAMEADPSVQMPEFTLVIKNPTTSVDVYESATAWCIANGMNLNIRYNYVTQGVINQIHAAGLKIGCYGAEDFYTVYQLLKTLDMDTITTNYKFFQ